jgi:tetrahydromethanopterin S-methyltransferase subunit G
LVKKGLIYKPRTPKTITDDDSIKEVKNSLKSLKESVDSMTTMLKQLTSNKQVKLDVFKLIDDLSKTYCFEEF